MAVTYQSPGVYIVEEQRGTRPIEAVGTSMAAFIGITAEASRKETDPETGQRRVVESRLNQATLISNWTQFVDIFGDFVPGAYLPEAVYGYFANGGGPCYVTSLRTLRENAADMKTAEVKIPGKGKPSFTVAAKTPGPAGDGLTVAIKPTGEETFDMTAAGETRAGLTMKRGENYVGDAVFDKVVVGHLTASSAMPDEGTYTLTGGQMGGLTAADFIGSLDERTGLGGLEVLDEVRLVLSPDVMAGYDGSQPEVDRVKAVQKAIADHCQKMRYRFAILDMPPGLNVQAAVKWRRDLNFDTSYAALYYPWVKIADLSNGGKLKLVPPSGHVAGLYNRTDAGRGVHKAPANDTLLGVLDLEIQISQGEQDQLNPLGVNCIRSFPGRGIRVWGARTLSSDGAWRYVNVRRLFNMVEASLDAGLQWVVFEPNDRTLWAKVRRDATSFLKTVWLSGALFGNTPEEAFYVKCDEELNPREIRDLGQLIIEVGLAPVKPAEFVIVRITQWAGADAEA